ncbi:MAG TPA: phosphatase PAP2 family protein [Candidatus Paceibacterota bacterium]|nr:phosphatase PAP2 family protein [Candidatus Paceibacterota bacterium]
MIAAWDLSVVQALAHMRTPLGIHIFSLITDLGGAFVVCCIFIAAFMLAEESKRWAYGAGMLIALSGSMAIAEELKVLIARERPPIDLRAIFEVGYSFPSEHATAAAALYGFLAFAAWTIGPRAYRGVLVVLCLAIIPLVMFSRVYLGVHYPSDVLAGALLGAFFAYVGVHVTRLLQHRKRVV